MSVSGRHIFDKCITFFVLFAKATSGGKLAPNAQRNILNPDF